MIELKGPWSRGFAYDLHIKQSTHLGEDAWGHPRFKNEYSQMGLLLKEFKYDKIISNSNKIWGLLEANMTFLDLMSEIDVIAPIPPSNRSRPYQPVALMAELIARALNKQLRLYLLCTSNTEQVKNIGTDERQAHIKRHLSIDKNHLATTSRILLFDDIFDSGSTLISYANALVENGYPNVSVFTLTKTKKAKK